VLSFFVEPVGAAGAITSSVALPNHRSIQRWAVALFSAVGIAIVFYVGFEAGLTAFSGSKLIGNTPPSVIKAAAIGFACVVGFEVLLWVLRLPERK